MDQAKKVKYFNSASSYKTDQNTNDKKQRRLRTLKKMDAEGVIKLGIDHKYLKNIDNSIHFDKMVSSNSSEKSTVYAGKRFI